MQPLRTITSAAVVLLSLYQPGSAQVQKLRSDPKLHGKVTIVELNPELTAVFEKFELATGLKFNLNESISTHRPKLGSFQFPNTRVWAIMDLLPKFGLEEGRWEKTAEGYRLTAKSILPERPASKPKADAPKDLYLRMDPRLRAKLLLQKQPTLRTILRQLGEATGLRFVLAENLQRHEPWWDMSNLREAPAWMVMGLAAETQLRDGRWEKTDQGYRLTGISNVPKAPPKAITATENVTGQLPVASPITAWLLWGLICMTCVCAGVAVYRHWKHIVQRRKESKT